MHPGIDPEVMHKTIKTCCNKAIKICIGKHLLMVFSIEGLMLQIKLHLTTNLALLSGQ